MSRACSSCTLFCEDDRATACALCETPLPALPPALPGLPGAASRKRQRGVDSDVVDLTASDEPSDEPAEAVATAPAAAHLIIYHKDCPICMEPLGTNGGVQALTCMDTFCRDCVATHIQQRVMYGDDVTCPLCKQRIPHAVQEACGPGKQLADSDESDEGESDEGEGEGDEGNDEEEGEEGGEEGGEEEDGLGQELGEEDDGEENDGDEEGDEEGDEDDGEDDVFVDVGSIEGVEDHPDNDVLLQRLLGA